MSENHGVTVVVGRFEPLAGADAAELGEIVTRHLPVLAASGEGLEYELLVRLKVLQGRVGSLVAEGRGQLRGAMLLTARETPSSGGVEVLTAVPRMADRVPRATVARDRGLVRVLPGEKPLTGRERDVLKGLSEGLTNRQIAVRLHITPETVHSHMRKIFRKLGVHDRRELTGMRLPDREN
jgi:DNA-binding CsgD family transcriptional regulator